MLEKKKTEERKLHELPGAVIGKVVTRIPPEPSKYKHVGHGLSFLKESFIALPRKRCIKRSRMVR